MYLFLFLIWIIFNGNITLEIVIFGLVISAIIFLFMCKFLDYSFKQELLLYRLAPRLVGYMLILIWEVIKANVATAKLVLNPRVVCEPKIFAFDSPVQSKLCQVLLANSITLTPGTISVNLDEGKYIIHCLDPELAEGIEESIFVQKLKPMDKMIKEAF